MNFEQQSILIVVLGVIVLLSAATNVVLIIGTFRRKPPIEAQFADLKQNADDHLTIHRRVSDLRDEVKRDFVTSGMFAADRAAANETRGQLLKTMELMNAKLDEFLELRGDHGARIGQIERQIVELFKRLNHPGNS